MPFPAQVQRAALIEKARELIEADGLDQLTLASLASAFDIAAPSLYHHFRNKTALLAAVNEATMTALALALQQASESVLTEQADPRAALQSMLHAYRAFALRNPATYSLLYANTVSALRPDPALAEQLAQPLQAVMARVAGEMRSLAALRGGWALVHGFVMLELLGQFQRGGSLDEAFAVAVTTYLNGLSA